VTHERSWTVELPVEYGHTDLTAEVEEWVCEKGLQTGTVMLQVVGSTGGTTTIEYEPGALSDLGRALEEIAPASGDNEHNARWADGPSYDSRVAAPEVANWRTASDHALAEHGRRQGPTCARRITGAIVRSSRAR